MDVKQIASNFQLIGSRIAELSVKNGFVTLNPSMKTKKDLELNHEIISIEHRDEQLVGVIQLHLVVTLSEGKNKIRIKMKNEGCFVCNSEAGEERFEQMLLINGITALYGIARAQILSISSQFFAEGNVILPMVNVMEYSKRLNTEKNLTK